MFKVGDKVRFKTTEQYLSGCPRPGCVYTVSGLKHDGVTLVEFDDDDDDTPWWRNDRFELVVFGSHTTLPVGSAERKDVPIYSGPFRYFPAALAGIARVCKLGSEKHNPGEPIQHNRALSKDHADCIGRHLLDLSEDYGHGVGRDERGVAQVDYIAWRACALAQEWHEQHDGAPIAPAATNVEGQ